MVSRNGRTIARYRYDYRGLRRQKSTEDGTTDFTYDPSGHLISQQTREGHDVGQRDYLWTDTAPIARIDGPVGQAKVHKDWLPQALMGFLHRHEREEHGHATQFYYFHTDAMGTPKLATNEKQQVVWRWNEDAFGATVAAEQERHGHRDHDRDHGRSHEIDVNLRYPGQYYDSETGLFYNWNRYYNPNTGRYSRSDPIGLIGGFNLFVYVTSNPLKYVDLEGLMGRDSNLGDRVPGTQYQVRIDTPHVPGQQVQAHIYDNQGIVLPRSQRMGLLVMEVALRKSCQEIRNY